MIRRPPRSTLSSSSAASDVYKRQGPQYEVGVAGWSSELLSSKRKPKSLSRCQPFSNTTNWKPTISTRQEDPGVAYVLKRARGQHGRNQMRIALPRDCSDSRTLTLTRSCISLSTVLKMTWSSHSTRVHSPSCCGVTCGRPSLIELHVPHGSRLPK